MSSYFDAFDKRVHELSREHQDGAAFIAALIEHESAMINDCELFAGDIETPEDVRQCVMSVISLSAIKPCPTMTNEGVKEMAEVGRASRLSADMHGLFHDIARMRYQMRYGMVFDNPAEAVRARDKQAQRKGRHPFQKKAPAVHLPLKLCDAPRYCYKALERLWAKETREG